MASPKSGRNVPHEGDASIPYLWDPENPRGYGNRIGRYRTSVQSGLLFAHLGAPPQAILDLGGGSGRFGSMLAKHGHHVTLIDNNPQAIEIARMRGIQRAVLCDISNFLEGGFDGVICLEVMEYFEKCESIFSKAYQSLKAAVIFSATNSRSWRFRLRSLRKSESLRVHAFSLAEMDSSLKANGFEIVRRQGFQWSLAQTGSDSLLVNASALIEKGLGLQRWLTQSPWLLYACRKVSDSKL